MNNPDEREIKDLLMKSKTIAVVGLSKKPDRDSYKVAKYLQEHGYRIIPVNPGAKEILGAKAYPSLASIPERVDIVNVFRRSEDTPPVVEAALPLRPFAVWLQLGIYNEKASDIAKERGIMVVMDSCIKIEHARLLGKKARE